MRRRILLLGLFGVVGLVGVLGAVSSSSASPPAAGNLYWGNGGLNALAHANVDGTNANQSFISGAGYPIGAAVDGDHVYWTNLYFGTISRADLDGTNVNTSFITTASSGYGVAVDAGHIYWTNFSLNTIGRANIDGTNVNQNFITGANSPLGVAVDFGHIYWTNFGLNTVGRANIDGTNVNQSFITGGSNSAGIAVDGGGHLYWANYGLNAIARANTDGTNVNQTFIPGAVGPYGVSADAGHVYWANLSANTIGRANVDGTSANQSFITGASSPYGVAVTTTLLGPRSTTCRGAYTGTGKDVVVPAGATCTLIPGTHVTRKVVVASGGTLYATGVTIDGSLFASGSATVCQSRIRIDVKMGSASGSLQLGGPDCQSGNTISHDVVVSNTTNDAWVWGNNIGNNLHVLNAHGATTSIVGNTVGNLLVANSGPVLVQDNSAKNGTLRCTANSSQTGSGNKAAGTNTCPK